MAGATWAKDADTGGVSCDDGDEFLSQIERAFSCDPPTPSSSSTAKPVVAPLSRCQFDAASLEVALELARQCADAERKGMGYRMESTWDQCGKLRPILNFVVHPEFTMPPRFQSVMDTCVACLLYSPEGHLRHTSRMADLLQSSDIGPTLNYLEWLEHTVRKMTPCRRVLVPQRARSALSFWQSECSLLSRSATALWEALLTQGPVHLRSSAEVQRNASKMQAVQEAQTQEVARIVRELEAAASQFDSALQEQRGQKLIVSLQDNLISVERLTAHLLVDHDEKYQTSFKEYEDLCAQTDVNSAVIRECSRRVKRHEQALGQIFQRFIELANQLISWTCVLVPKLRQLEQHRKSLCEAVSIQNRLHVLEKERLEAEDESDAASTELRKHRRHASANVRCPPRNTANAANAALEKQLEIREQHAKERVDELNAEVADVERRYDEVVADLPLVVLAENTDESPEDNDEISAEQRLALKIAELQETHEVVALQVSELQAEHDKVLVQVDERRAETALRRRIEPDLMCPIMHETMSEPVLAADGHTYERQAIERWLQMHNTSPMTGAPLAHRYLTENFALRHLIASYESNLPKDLDEDEDDDVEEESESIGAHDDQVSHD